MKKVALAGTESLTNYIEALRENDIEVITTLNIDEAMECDGLLLPGGGDIDSAYYGEEMDGSEEPDRELDKAQRDILDAFVKMFVSSFGCSYETADIEFAFTLSQALDKGNNLAHHLIQSFEPGEAGLLWARNGVLPITKVIPR